MRHVNNDSPKLQNPVLSAYGTVATLFMIVFVLGNLLSIPFILAGFAQDSREGKFVSSQAIARFTMIGEGPSEQQLAQLLSRRFFNESIGVKISGNEVFVAAVAAQGSAQPETYQIDLERTLTTSGIRFENMKPFKAEMKPPSPKEIMESPWALIGGGLSLQLIILLVWLISRKVFFVGDKALPALHVGNFERPILWGGLIGVALSLIANSIDSGIREVFDLSSTSMWDTVATFPPMAKMGIIAMGVIGAPILEEIFFRGMILGQFIKVDKPAAGIVVSSLLFGISHMQDIAIIITITLMGLMLGLTYVKTKSIYACIVAHMVNNAISFGMLMFTQ